LPSPQGRHDPREEFAMTRFGRHLVADPALSAIATRKN